MVGDHVPVLKDLAVKAGHSFQSQDGLGRHIAHEPYGPGLYGTYLGLKKGEALFDLPGLRLSVFQEACTL